MLGKAPEPLAIGTRYGRSRVVEVIATDLTDDHQPYCYKLANGVQVWIPVTYVADQEPAYNGCNCEHCRRAREEIDDDDEEDLEWDPAEVNSDDGDDYDDDDEVL